MNEAEAAVIGMATVALVIIICVLALPQSVADFIRGITRFKWGLDGIEIERNAQLLRERQGSLDEVKRALATTPTSGWVLWVDDHPEYNVAEIDVLRRRGVNVDIASTNTGAVDLATRRPYDAVISDIGRDNGEGETAGLELPDDLEKTLGTRLPVIFYTLISRDTGIDGTVSTSTPAELFEALGPRLSGSK